MRVVWTRGTGNFDACLCPLSAVDGGGFGSSGAGRRASLTGVCACALTRVDGCLRLVTWVVGAWPVCVAAWPRPYRARVCLARVRGCLARGWPGADCLSPG